MREVERKCRAKSISKKLPLFEHVLVGVIYEETAYFFHICVFHLFLAIFYHKVPKGEGDRCQHLPSILFPVKTLKHI